MERTVSYKLNSIKSLKSSLKKKEQPNNFTKT